MLKFDHKLAIAIIIIVLAVIGIFYILIIPKGPYVTDADRARYACVFLCQAEVGQGRYLEEGPCLSSGLSAWDIQGWVCDVAHSPRSGMDNLPENQCPEFGVTATHFVEVTPQCQFIRAV
jgi:hypothetical protein